MRNRAILLPMRMLATLTLLVLLSVPAHAAGSSTQRGFAISGDLLFLIQPTEEAKIAIFDATGRWLGSTGTEEPGQQDTILSPVEMVSDASGTVFVLDQFGPTIIALSPSGQVVNRWGERGFEPGQMRQPVDFGIDDSGILHVLDLGREAVIRFSGSGQFVGEALLAPEETVDIHWSTAIGVAGDGGFMLVADSAEGDVLRNLRRFSPSGRQLEQLTLAKIESSGQISDVAMLPKGGFLFADTQPRGHVGAYTGAVYRFTGGGEYDGRIFIRDRQRGKSYSPARIKTLGPSIFVLTTTNLVVEVDGDGNVIRQWGAGELGH